VFTGLIEDMGEVSSLERRSRSAILSVTTLLPSDEIKNGDSISVNGVCLTVTGKKGNIVSFDLSPESLSCTTTGELKSGKTVNLERAMKLGDRLGGHLVSGHVDCVATVKKAVLISENLTLEFEMPPDKTRYIIDKGSVAVDGVSLTVNNVTASGFSVNIIPTTLKTTTMQNLKSGNKVNIETDIIGKYLEKLSTPWKKEGGLTLEMLSRNGFI